MDLKRQYFQVYYERIPNVVLTVISEFKYSQCIPVTGFPSVLS